jgi:hypothetical protein
MPVRLYPLIFRVRNDLKILLLYFAIAPLLTAIFLFSNFTFTTSQKISSYKIIDFDVYYSDHTLQIYLENPNDIMHYQLRRFSTDTFNFLPDSAAYQVHQGCFGIDVIKGAYLIRKN